MQVNKNLLEQLLLNQSHLEVCEKELKKHKEKYEHLRKTWQNYTMSAKRSYTAFKETEKELEKKNKEIRKIANKLNAFEKKVSRGSRSTRGKKPNRYSPK